MSQEDKGRNDSYSTPLPPPRPSFSYTARPSSDSIRSLADHSYSPLFTNGLYDSSIMANHRPNPPSPPTLSERLVDPYANLPDPSTFSTPAKKKSSSSLISSLGSKSPFSRRRRKQSSSAAEQTASSLNTNTPGKNSLASSQSSLKTSPPVKGKRTSPYKSPSGKQTGEGVGASWKRLEKESKVRVAPGSAKKGKSSTSSSSVFHGQGQGEFFRSPRHEQAGGGRDGTHMFQPGYDQGDMEMMDVDVDIDPATDLQNDISALETINGMLGLPLPSDKPRQEKGPKKKRSLLGFAVRGGSKVPFVDQEVQGGESVGRKSGGWVRASMEHFSRDAPTPPPMTPLPPLPQMMDKLSVNPSSTTTTTPVWDSTTESRRPNLKPFRLRSLLNLNMMGTPKKQQAPTLQMHASPASFVGGGRYSPGESPEKENGSFSPPFSRFSKVDPHERAGLDLPPRPGTSLGLCTPKKQIATTTTTTTGRSGSQAFGVTGNASTPTLPGLPTSGSHWSNTNPAQGRSKMSMGPGGRMPPPRPSSRPSLGPEKVMPGRPSLSESRERAMSPPLLGKTIINGQNLSLASRSKTPLLPRSSSNNIPSDRTNADKRSGKVFAGKPDSPVDGLPFQNGDGWSTPYPTNENINVDVDITKSSMDMGYPFPAIPNIKSRSSIRASVFEPPNLKKRESGKTGPRSRFDSSAFEYQAFETDHILARNAAGKESRESSPPLSGKSGYETTKSSGMLPSRSGTALSVRNEDKENLSTGGSRKSVHGGALSLGRIRPLPAVFNGGGRGMRG